ncbi:MAG: hypothetical protein HYV65_00095 [Candidatus Spechtbacteria bacterium]|nr:hypothetical protein [Candidatus Spechtbacteria bacterium]
MQLLVKNGVLFYYLKSKNMPRKEADVAYKPEIERKFLVRSFPIEVLRGRECYWIQQAYPRFKRGIRVREKLRNPYIQPPASISSVPDGPTIISEEWQGTITMKARANNNDWRTQIECESPIDLEFVREFSKGAPGVRKARYVIGRFELDIYTSPQLRGLVVMEIELKNAAEQVYIPDGFDVVEVTEDQRFRSASLARLKTRKAMLELLRKYGIALKEDGQNDRANNR